MNGPAFDLADLFSAALQAVANHCQELNILDGVNGNHGDNMVDNVHLIVESLQAQRSRPPAEALRYASQRLQSDGHGGTSQYYAEGLGQAAERLQGHATLDANDVMLLAQSLLSAIPSQAGDSVLEQFLHPPAAPRMHRMYSSASSASSASPQGASQDSRQSTGNVLNVLVPAGLAFLQAQPAGTDPASAVGQALTGVLLGGHVDPLQSGNSRTAAAGLIVKSMLQMLNSRR
jgi:hypothetical protein